jgi:hypothetical protein
LTTPGFSALINLPNSSVTPKKWLRCFFVFKATLKSSAKTTMNTTNVICIIYDYVWYKIQKKHGINLGYKE